MSVAPHAATGEPAERPSLWHTWYVRGAMVALLVVSLLGWYVTRESLPDSLAIATAAPGGQYHKFGTILQPHLERSAGRRVELRATAGSPENRELLLGGQVQLAILQSGSVPMEGLAALAPLYREALHVVVRAGSPIQGLGDLKGRKVVLGPEGSGMRQSALAILRHYRIEERELTAHAGYFLELEQDPSLDAALVTTGLENEDLRALLSTGQYALLPVLDAEAISIRAPYFEPIKIPRGLFHEGPPVPAEDTPTVGTTAFLAARSDSGKKLVDATLEALYANHLKLDLPTLIPQAEAARWGLLPLHPAARAYHDPYEGIGLLANFLESISAIKELLFALGAGLYLLWDRWQLLKERARRAEVNREKEHLDSLLDRTVAIERAQMTCEDPAKLREMLDEVTRIKIQALEELTHEDLRGDRLFSIFLMQCANLIRKIQGKILALRTFGPRQGPASPRESEPKAGA
ncbi:MAG: TAXI family TRAP transporter solute-binding subunit [Planctomycetota bacterium]|nr:TAXI family TRAP transporter solute-binding subunit [Planctomycetota bacterium]